MLKIFALYIYCRFRLYYIEKPKRIVKTEMAPVNKH